MTLPGEIPTAAVATGVVDVGEEGAITTDYYSVKHQECEQLQ